MRKPFILFLVLGLFASLLMACSDDTEEAPDGEETNWTESESFQTGNYPVRGVEGRLAVDDLPFVAGENEHYIMYFWGETQELLNGPVKIEALHESTGDVEKAIVNYAGTSDEEKSWDINALSVGDEMGHMPVTLSLPYEGLWRLDIYIGEEYFESIIVEAIKSDEA